MTLGKFDPNPAATGHSGHELPDDKVIDLAISRSFAFLLINVGLVVGEISHVF